MLRTADELYLSVARNGADDVVYTPSNCLYIELYPQLCRAFTIRNIITKPLTALIFTGLRIMVHEGKAVLPVRLEMWQNMLPHCIILYNHGTMLRLR